MNPKLKQLLDEAVYLQPDLMISRADLNTARGWTQEALDWIGLNRTVMKRLESIGVALRGYQPRVVKDEWRRTYHRGKHRSRKVQPRIFGLPKHTGHQVKWVIFKD